MPARLKSVMPNPPNSWGKQTVSHATLHFPPATEDAPAQMNPRLSLSMASIAHGESAKAIAVWTGMAERVALASAVRPATLSSPPFQAGIRIKHSNCISNYKIF
jgi:hypothetical protein